MPTCFHCIWVFCFLCSCYYLVRLFPLLLFFVCSFYHCCLRCHNYCRSFIFVVVVVVGGVFVLLVCLVGGGCCCFLGEGGCVFCLFFVLVGIAVIVIFVASH